MAVRRVGGLLGQPCRICSLQRRFERKPFIWLKVAMKHAGIRRTHPGIDFPASVLVASDHRSDGKLPARAKGAGGVNEQGDVEWRFDRGHFVCFHYRFTTRQSMWGANAIRN